MKKHRVGIIGLGMALKPHIHSLLDLKDRVEGIVGFSPSLERREKFVRDYASPVVDSLDTLLGDPSIDAVVILTPPWTHDELTRKAAAAGKHILLEKPLDVNTERATALVTCCQHANVTLGVVFQHRFRPGSLKLREMLQNNELGKVLSVSTSVRWWRGPEYYAELGRGMHARDGGGVLLTQAIHSLDLLVHLVGMPASVMAIVDNSGLRKIDTEDKVAAVVRWENGASGVIDATTVAYPGYPERIEIAGTLGSAVLEIEQLTVALKDGTRFVHGGKDVGASSADPMAFSHVHHKKMIEEFLNAIDEGRAPMNSGVSALGVQRLIDAVIRSGRERCEITV